MELTRTVFHLKMILESLKLIKLSNSIEVLKTPRSYGPYFIRTTNQYCCLTWIEIGNLYTLYCYLLINLTLIYDLELYAFIALESSNSRHKMCGNVIAVNFLPCIMIQLSTNKHNRFVSFCLWILDRITKFSQIAHFIANTGDVMSIL